MADRELTRRRITGRLTPSAGYSLHCRTPWWRTDGHTVWDDRDPDHQPWRRGTFALCEWCWPRTTVEQRVAYAEELVFGVWPAGGTPLDRCEADWPAIERAYREAT